MSPAKRRVIVSLSCLGLVKFSCGGSSRGTSSAGSFMICEVVPQEKNNMEMKRKDKNDEMWNFKFTSSPKYDG